MERTRSRLRARVWGLIALVVLAITLAAVAAPLNVVAYGVPLFAAFPLAVAQAGAIPLALRMPRLGAALSLAAFVGFARLSVDSSGAPWPVTVTTMIAMFAVIAVLGMTGPGRRAFITWALGVLLAIVMIAGTPQRYAIVDSSITDVIVFSSNGAAVLFVAVLIRQRRSIRGQLLEERRLSAEAEAARIIVEERNSIARELHDVIAHGMSVIQVQATSARYRLPDLAPEAAAEFDEIAATARQALGEMRRVLAVLRGSADGELAPLPGLEQLDELVATAERAGVAVTRGSTDFAGAPESVSLTAYRIVQEALSNVIRHAPGATATVTIARDGDALLVRVENTAATETPAPTAGGGHGLIGMRERVSLLGGQLEAGETADGGFLVLATLPWGNE